MTTEAASPNGYWQTIQAAARREKMLPRFWGLTTSCGILNRGALRRQYRAHQAAMERLAVGPNLWPWVTGGIGACVGLLVGIMVLFVDESSGLAVHQDQAAWVQWLQPVIVVAIGFGTMAPVGLVLMIKKYYQVAYATTLVLEKCDQAEPWKVTMAGRTNLLRLAFVADSTEGYFVGSTQDTGVNQGRIVLESRTPLKDLTLSDLYQLPPSLGTFQGTNSRVMQTYTAEVEQAGEIMRNRNRSRFKNVQDVALLVAAVVALILVFFQAQSFYSLDVREADQYVEDVLEGGQ